MKDLKTQDPISWGKERSDGMIQAKWKGILSTTEPYNHLGLIKVRQGNQQTEVFDFQISQQHELFPNLNQYDVYFQTVSDRLPVEIKAEVIDSQNSLVRLVMNDYCMQKTGKHQGNFCFKRDNQVVGTTQDFTYVVMPSPATANFDTGAYWQSAQDLIDEMTQWIEEIKETLGENAAIELGNQVNQLKQELISVKQLLTETNREVIEARKSTASGQTFVDLGTRLNHLEESHYTLPYEEVVTLRTLQDDRFSLNHQVVKEGTVATDHYLPGLVVAEIGNPNQDTFYLEKVGEL